MNSKTLRTTFVRRNPELQILPKIEAATAPITFAIQKKHARGAKDGICDCTNARALRDLPGVIDAMVGLSHAHVLVKTTGDKARIVRYRLTPGARSVVEANDAGLPVWGMAMTLTPPSPSERPGVATKRIADMKIADPKDRVKQSKEHVAKRLASRKKSVGRRLLSSAS